jgi:hypothetical protein
MKEVMKMMNVRIIDNGSAYVVSVNGLITSAHNSLGNAWKHIEWMYRVASQKFTVGEKEVPVTEWIAGMRKAGYLD